MTDITKISPLPQPPQRADAPDVFAGRADAFVAALLPFREQLNELGGDVQSAIAGNLVKFDGFAGVWSAGTFDAGQVVFHTPSNSFYISLQDGETAEPPDGDWRKIGITSAEDVDYENASSGLASDNVQDAIDETIDRLRNETYAVKQSTQTVTSTNKNFFEITDFTPGLSITIPPERSDAEIEIDVHLSFSGQHFTENDAGWEFALTDNQQTGGSTTITAISRATYEYESTGASDGRNTLSGTAHLRTRLSPGEGVHQFKLFSRNVQQSGTVTLSIQGSSSEQNSTVLIRELI